MVFLIFQIVSILIMEDRMNYDFHPSNKVEVLDLNQKV